ncbi:MAG: hypothetical protein JW889_14665 [Verrucomicrobia bacterium]|nr:hypothetical protein [Verrucomicrobiota bacterium]
MTILLAAGALAIGFAPLAMAAEEEQPTTITIDGQTYSIAPDEEVRKLGLDVPDVKPEENAANDLLKAMEVYHPLGGNDSLRRLRDEVLQSGWTEDAGPLAEYLERNEDALKWIRVAASKDACRFPMLLLPGISLEDVSPSAFYLPHLGKMREFARFLVTAGKAYEFEGRTAEALDAYLLALRLGNLTAQDSTLIAGLVGLACNAIAGRAIEQCLVRNEIENTTLVEAQKRLAALAEERPNVVVTMRGEQAFSTATFEYMLSRFDGTKEFSLDLGDHEVEPWERAMAKMVRTAEGRAQMRADVQVFWDAMDKAMQVPLPEFIRTGAGEEPIREAEKRKSIMALLGPAISHARVSYARNDLSWTVLDVEFALARYAAANGQYPESLDALKDLMLSDGIDPYSGKPLHYRLEADGAYTIWSVAENLTDDGGKIPAKHFPTSGRDDHVWNSAVIHGED